MSEKRPSRDVDVATKEVSHALPPPLGVCLRVERGNALVQRYVLAQGSCVVGAGSDADLIVEDEEVSRRHVELTLVAEGVALRDLGSRNGTYYLGQRLDRAILRLGSRIRLGNSEIVCELDPTVLSQAASVEASYGGLSGATESMRTLFTTLQRIEGSLVPVLIGGESGTGKELVARAVHARSSVRDGDLIILNCGAISRELVRSELFGHRRGAFTGAETAHSGAFQAADGGTLFLDEIGELPLDVQPMLLRALESGEITPIGENKATIVNTRVVAATNRDLRIEVQEGRFREDLYYRLAVVRLEMPPLRERKADVPALAQEFARQAGGAELPDSVLEELSRHTWPGNVRELRNAVLAFLAVGALPDSQSREVNSLAQALAEVVDVNAPYHVQKDWMVAQFSKVYFRELLASTNGNQSEAARQCGLERNFLRRLLRRYEVDS